MLHAPLTHMPAWPLASLQSLLGKLDTLLVVQGAAPSQPARAADADAAAEAVDVSSPGAAAEAAEVAPPPADARADEEPSSSTQEGAAEAGETEVAAVSLEQGEDGQVAFKLTLSPSKLAAAAEAAAEATQQHADPGHMPVSPASAAGSSAQRPFARRRTEAAAPRPGALHDGAARGAHPAAMLLTSLWRVGALVFCDVFGMSCTLLPNMLLLLPPTELCPPACRADVLPAGCGGHPQAAADGGGAGRHPEAHLIQAAAGVCAPHQPPVRCACGVRKRAGCLLFLFK